MLGGIYYNSGVRIIIHFTLFNISDADYFILITKYNI